ncbi:MAG: hypothetical protein ACLR3C_18675 [Eggerthella lenta]
MLFVLSSIAAVIVPLAFSGTADGTVQTTPERAEAARRAPPWPRWPT